MRFFLILLMSGTLVSCNSSSNSKPGDTCGLSCARGNEQGNGADYIVREHGSAWFLDDTDIKYCIEMSSGFGVDKAFASDAIQKAFSKWITYIEKKKINDPTAYETYYHVKLATKFTELASCDGSEQLTFYLGVQNEKTHPYEQQFAGSIAKTVRTYFNRETTEGTGFIWIAPRDSVQIPDFDADSFGNLSKNFPDWQLSYNLQGVLTHEFGHVFGVPHISDTIMFENIAALVKANSITEGINAASHAKAREYYFTHIDWGRELVICDSCELDHEGNLGFNQQWANDEGTHIFDITSEAFEVLTGRKPSADYKAVHAKIRGSYVKGLELVVGDDLQDYVFSLDLDLQNRVTFISNSEIFKVLEKFQDSFIPSGIRSEGHSIPGQLVTNQGNKINISLDRNVKWMLVSGSSGETFVVGGPLLIRYSFDGKIKSLFNYYWSGF